MFISPNKREIVGLPPVMDKYRSIYIMTFSSKTMKKNPLMVACITQVYFDIAIVLSIILLKKKKKTTVCAAHVSSVLSVRRSCTSVVVVTSDTYRIIDTFPTEL